MVEFRRVAEELASSFKSIEGVIGIVFLGGIARGYADEDSDVDVSVFINVDDQQVRERLRAIAQGAQHSTGLDVDIEIHRAEDFFKRQWSEVDRWELGRAEIFYDPTGEIRRMFDAGGDVPDDFWTTKIVTCSTYLAWYSCPQEGQGCVAETWIRRGDLLSANYCIHYSLDLILELVFALNREFLPPPKWRVHYARNLEWIPEGFVDWISMSVPEAKSEDDLRRRLGAMRKMWPEILEKVKGETGLDSEAISLYYVREILGQN